MRSLLKSRPRTGASPAKAAGLIGLLRSSGPAAPSRKERDEEMIRRIYEIYDVMPREPDPVAKNPQAHRDAACCTRALQQADIWAQQAAPLHAQVAVRSGAKIGRIHKGEEALYGACGDGPEPSDAEQN
jgi:hypothetical protein